MFSRTTLVRSFWKPSKLQSSSFGADVVNLIRSDSISAQKTFAKPLGIVGQSYFSSAIVHDKKEQSKLKTTILKKKKNVRSVGLEVPPRSFPSLLKAKAACTAEHYEASLLFPQLKKNFIVMPYMADDVYYIKLSDPSISRTGEDKEAAEAFIFTDGTYVTWGASEEQASKLAETIKSSQVNPYTEAETDEFDYYSDTSQVGSVTADTIIIGSDLPEYQAKLALSSGLARSVKLGALEILLEQHLLKHRNIPKILLSGKKPSMSRNQVHSTVGELFILRGQLNLHSELLDSPDFCWSSAKMEELFEKITRNLDVRARISVFNKKLDYAGEIADVLRNHLHEKHSLSLEWCIIILITVEIMFNILHYLERLGYVEIPDVTRK